MPEEHQIIWKLSLKNGAIDFWKLRCYLSLFFYKEISTSDKHNYFWENQPKKYLFHKVALKINGNTDQAAQILEKTLKSINPELFFDLDINSANLAATEEERNKKAIEALSIVLRSDIKFSQLYDDLMDLYSYYGTSSEDFTPKTISDLLIKLLNANVDDLDAIYDPASASGYLLTRFINFCSNQKIYVYAHELNKDTLGIFKMNLLLSNSELAESCLANTFSKEINRKFRGIISNPYCLGRIQKEKISSQINLAFIYKCLLYLDSKNPSTLILTLPESIFTSKHKEILKIKTYLFQENLVECIIKLPKKCFYGAEKNKCIFIIKKNRTKNEVLFIDSSKQVTKINSQFFLSPENIDWILNRYKEAQDVQYLVKSIPIELIFENQYDLSFDLYIPQGKKPKKKIVLDPTTKPIPSRVSLIPEEEPKSKRKLLRILKNLFSSKESNVEKPPIESESQK